VGNVYGDSARVVVSEVSRIRKQLYCRGLGPNYMTNIFLLTEMLLVAHYFLFIKYDVNFLKASAYHVFKFSRSPTFACIKLIYHRRSYFYEKRFSVLLLTSVNEAICFYNILSKIVLKF